MQDVIVHIQFAIRPTDSLSSQIVKTMDIKRKTKDAGQAIATITALINSLSNFVYDNGVHYIEVIKAYTVDNIPETSTG